MARGYNYNIENQIPKLDRLKNKVSVTQLIMMVIRNQNFSCVWSMYTVHVYTHPHICTHIPVLLL